MRPIDADAIIKEYTSEDMAIGGLEIIKTAPTVEAIPIEWIIKWNEDYAPRDYQEMTEDMIADWHEERGYLNEQRLDRE